MSQPEAYDAVVIGAGVCGAIAAWQLACTGHRVLILEAGPKRTDRTVLVGNYAGDIAHGTPYHDPGGDRFAPTEDTMGGYYIDAGPRRFKSSYVRRVGGSTWHFLGNTPRFIPADFELKTRYQVGVDWPLGYDQLEPDYCTAEQQLGVSGDHREWNQSGLGARSQPFPMESIWPSHSDRVIHRLLGQLEVEGVPIRLRTTPQARNSRPYDDRPACAGNSSCVPVCPIQAKYDATVHIKKALHAGAQLRSQAVVSAIDAAPNGTVTVVHYLDWAGHHHRVQGRIVVLAANAIESARLLLLSGLANRSDQVGRNLMDHPQGAVVALAPEPVFPFRGPPTTSGIDAFRDGDFRNHSAAFRLSLGNDGWGRSDRISTRLASMISGGRLFGSDLRDAVEEQFIHMIRFSYSTELLPDAENRVQLDGSSRDQLNLPRPKISFQLDDYTISAFAHAQQVCTQIFQATGAREIQPLLPNDDNAPAEQRFVGAGHISGTCRMGTDSSSSVVDDRCRSHDHPNLFIIGCAVFPTEGTANPTLTAAALTNRSLPAMAEMVRQVAP
jgi:choline dehydrogenase-like flavoprotein